MLDSDKDENKNPEETGDSRTLWSKGTKMKWVKRDMPKKPYLTVNEKPDWSRSAPAKWLNIFIEEF